ncbi:MAG TPA: hypothetical protein VGI81_07035 [Tepidisphaeraceae bacterium]|jgi:hypothetical protein
MSQPVTRPDPERDAARQRLAESLGHLVAAEWLRRRQNQLGSQAVLTAEKADREGAALCLPATRSKIP